MAKILALITALESVEAHKALAAEARAELGQLVDLEAKDLSSRLQKGDAAVVQVSDLAKQVEKLGAEVKGAEGLKATVEKFQADQRLSLITQEVTAKAKEFGLRAEAVPTILKLADLSGVKVDGEKKSISGLTKELFEPLRKEHSVVFTASENSNATIAPPPPAGAGNVTQSAPALKIDGPVGGFLAAIKS